MRNQTTILTTTAALLAVARRSSRNFSASVRGINGSQFEPEQSLSPSEFVLQRDADTRLKGPQDIHESHASHSSHHSHSSHCSSR
jgi:hypothetical protein